MSSERLYFRQLLSGRDYAVGDPIATQMRNFAYLIGDRETGETLLVDPAYQAADLVDVAAADGMRVSGVLATHHHPDHVGGTMLGFTLGGVRELLEKTSVPVHVNKQELDWVAKTTGIAPSELTGHDNGDTVSVGAFDIELLHTPGHTPGSQCFLFDGRLISGDTLFVDGCGRTDFPGGDSEEMFRSLRHLAGLSGNPVVYPGHWYSEAPSAELSSIRDNNYVLRPQSLQQWQALMPG
ncbi:MBL fold metallo-hydrolase [Nocardia caishijiensis]|uniref:Glyoxylase-like metal-dependent hydrolase (Beta-lactamase superfamily II) n=1 Tax=Nocardia caishijiensis TaxID=184756 RepID=A0ABQ6YG09_9NOCA|nr:MBL fold metallo-hydrolase [Nocardia caishijiensis]KAF0842528.1 glyoxylase-like metal-dependent hydrolase (beta-lactamase superfamily II) [Nocardia caishijiensis]